MRFIDAIVEPALWFVADWSLRWAVLIGVVMLFFLLLRPRRAAMRQLLLLVVLAGGLFLPFTPRWGGWRLVKETAAPPQTTSFPRSAWERTSGRSASRPARTADATRSVATVRSHAERGNETPSSGQSLGSRRLIVLGLVLCWSVVVVFHLIRWLGGWWFLRKLRHSALTLQGSTADVFAVCRAELGISGRVRLAAHPHVHSPILFGLFAPLILVPPNWLQLPLDVQRAGLLHELAHIRRRDHWLAPLLEIIRIAFFFHPLLRWLLIRLERERELLCDEMVVDHGIDRHDYARMLLDFARQSSRLTRPRLLSESYLPIGRRRTVKVRIHHLLEDDMERWIRPLPARWAIVLGAGLLALMLGLASYRVLAVENKKTNAPAEQGKPALAPKEDNKDADTEKSTAKRLKREELRYGDKDFNQWRRNLLTELKGSIRVDGMKAFAAFGANGYAPEATRAILDLMRGYDTTNGDPKDDDGAVVAAGYRAIDKIGAAAVPVLTAAVKNANRNVRRFAIQALGRLRTDARSAIPVLLRAMKSDDPVTRYRALDALDEIDRHAKGVLAALIEALKDKSEGVRFRAVRSIENIGKKAQPAIAALIEVLSDESDRVKSQTISALKAVGAGKEAAVPVSRLLQDENISIIIGAFRFLRSLGADAKGAVVPVSRLLRGKNHQTRQEAFEILRSLGADAKEAVPALIAILKDPKNRYKIDAVVTLAGIGPGAKEAIPALNELLRSERLDLRESVVRALRAISP